MRSGASRPVNDATDHAMAEKCGRDHSHTVRKANLDTWSKKAWSRKRSVANAHVVPARPPGSNCRTRAPASEARTWCSGPLRLELISAKAHATFLGHGMVCRVVDLPGCAAPHRCGGLALPRTPRSCGGTLWWLIAAGARGLLSGLAIRARGVSIGRGIILEPGFKSMGVMQTSANLISRYI